MEKSPKCDVNCFECPYPDCIYGVRTAPQQRWEVEFLACAELGGTYHIRKTRSDRKRIMTKDAQRLREARIRKRMTLKEVGRLVGLHISTISNYEHGYIGFDPNLFNGILW